MKSQTTDRALDASPERRRAVECSSPSTGSVDLRVRCADCALWETLNPPRGFCPAREAITLGPIVRSCDLHDPLPNTEVRGG